MSGLPGRLRKAFDLRNRLPSVRWLETECVNELVVAHLNRCTEIEQGLVDHRLVFRDGPDCVVDEEADVLAPKVEECSLFVGCNTPDQFGQFHAVSVESAGRSGKRIRFSKLPPYSSVRRFDFGLMNWLKA